MDGSAAPGRLFGGMSCLTLFRPKPGLRRDRVKDKYRGISHRVLSSQKLACLPNLHFDFEDSS